MGVAMRTNIVLDDDLVEEAMQLADISTKREVVDAALREFVANRKRLDLRDLKGSRLLRSGFDHKGLRAGVGEHDQN
jgi:Arc/MetJ family transcription regulator